MARQEINTFYQRLKTCGAPTFETRVEGPQTICLLTLPAVSNGSGAFDATKITGTGRNKKAAISEASEKGIAFLEQQAAFQALKPSGSLWDVISQLLTPEVLRKEPEFEGHLLLAQQFNQGWIPIQLLSCARPVTNWVKQHLPQALLSPEAFLAAIGHQIQSQPPDSVPCGFELDAQKLAIRRVEPYAGREGFDVVNPLLATIARGRDRSFACVLIPADESMPAREVAVEGGGWFWSSLAAALDVPPAEMLYWGKFGASREVLLEDPEEAAELDDAGLSEMLATHFGPLPAARSPQPTASTQQAKQEPAAGNEGSECFTDVRPPVMYSQAGSTTTNRRASFLLRKELHGDALVSFCRLRACEWRTPSVKWASLNLPVFSMWAAASLPTGQVNSAASAPLLAALPHTFRSAKAWTGQLPADVLQQLLPAELVIAQPQYTARATSDDPDAAWEGVGTLRIQGEAEWAGEASGCMTQQAAVQAAALQLLHRLDGFLRRLWATGVGRDVREMTHTAVGNVKVLRVGEGDLAAPGGLLDFKYRLTASEGAWAGRTLASGSGRTCWASGDVLPAVTAAMIACKPGGLAECALRLQQKALVMSHAPSWPTCRLELEPDQRLRWVGMAQGSQPSLFEPPLSTQRCQKMAELLREAGCETIIDVGCGDGRLLEFLATKAKAGDTSIRALVGLDISASALKRGATRLVSRNPGLFQGSSAPHVRIFHADAVCQAATLAEFWGALRGVDAAVFQEVVEHLDPSPLALLGPCLLAALRPKRLLVSTPNREYNQLLNSLQPHATMPNGLRNSDHRFEWTRAEFQDWGDDLARHHGYSVSYQGLGRATQDSGEADVGLSTQVAVFEKGAGDCAPIPGAAFEASLVFDSATAEVCPGGENNIRHIRERDGEADGQVSQRRRMKEA